MKKRSFHGEFTKLTGSIIRAVSSGGDPGEEEIHELRLAVKALRTVLDLAGFVGRKKLPSRELRAMLSPVFDAAGEVRTAQMNLILLRKKRAHLIAACEDALLRDEATSRKALALLLEGFDRGAFLRAAAGPGALIEGLENARVAVYAEQFLRARYRTIFRILKKAKTPRELHEIRKNVKSARNTLRLIAACSPGRRSGIEERIVRTIDQTLGRWHDETVFRKRLRSLAAGAAGTGAGEKLNIAAPRPGGDGGRQLASLVRETRRRMTALRRALRLS